MQHYTLDLTLWQSVGELCFDTAQRVVSDETDPYCQTMPGLECDIAHLAPNAL